MHAVLLLVCSLIAAIIAVPVDNTAKCQADMEHKINEVFLRYVTKGLGYQEQRIMNDVISEFDFSKCIGVQFKYKFDRDKLFAANAVILRETSNTQKKEVGGNEFRDKRRRNRTGYRIKLNPGEQQRNPNYNSHTRKQNTRIGDDTLNAKLQNPYPFPNPINRKDVYPIHSDDILNNPDLTKTHFRPDAAKEEYNHALNEKHEYNNSVPKFDTITDDVTLNTQNKQHDNSKPFEDFVIPFVLYKKSTTSAPVNHNNPNQFYVEENIKSQDEHIVKTSYNVDTQLHQDKVNRDDENSHRVRYDTDYYDKSEIMSRPNPDNKLSGAFVEHDIQGSPTTKNNDDPDQLYEKPPYKLYDNPDKSHTIYKEDNFNQNPVTYSDKIEDSTNYGKPNHDVDNSKINNDDINPDTTYTGDSVNTSPKKDFAGNHFENVQTLDTTTENKINQDRTNTDDVDSDTYGNEPKPDVNNFNRDKTYTDNFMHGKDYDKFNDEYPAINKKDDVFNENPDPYVDSTDDMKDSHKSTYKETDSNINKVNDDLSSTYTDDSVNHYENDQKDDKTTENSFNHDKTSFNRDIYKHEPTSGINNENYPSRDKTSTDNVMHDDDYANPDKSDEEYQYEKQKIHNREDELNENPDPILDRTEDVTYTHKLISDETKSQKVTQNNDKTPDTTYTDDSSTISSKEDFATNQEIYEHNQKPDESNEDISNRDDTHKKDITRDKIYNSIIDEENEDNCKTSAEEKLGPRFSKHDKKLKKVNRSRHKNRKNNEDCYYGDELDNDDDLNQYYNSNGRWYNNFIGMIFNLWRSWLRGLLRIIRYYYKNQRDEEFDY